ncbi:MAG: stage II sporulation protein P [Clostridiales bacterium]|nr:stage II sporulation protein P [Clostridiales bacterium]
MKNKSKLVSMVVIMAIIFTTISPIGISRADNWYEDEPGFFTLFDEEGNELTTMASEMFKEDEYISSDNKHYSISRVDKKGKRAHAKFLGEIQLPEFEEIDDMSMEAIAPKEGDRSILLYCTHSDESYVPSDGKPSIPAEGGIYDVAESFKNSLEKKGIKVVLDKTSHDPHDAGAYRRSRQTAMDLIRKNMPIAAVFDLHRDATPKHTYETSVDGEYMSKVRIVIGKRNQNRKVNEELAYKIKAIADKSHPGLIKDIYIGRGEYNQELSPRSLLFEFGTHEISKEAAQKATVNMADVVNKAIFGGVFKSKEHDKGQEEKGETKETRETKERSYKAEPISQEEGKGAGSGILWFIIIAAIGIVVFTLISKSRNEMADSFNNIFGKKKRE